MRKTIVKVKLPGIADCKDCGKTISGNKIWCNSCWSKETPPEGVENYPPRQYKLGK